MLQLSPKPSVGSHHPYTLMGVKMLYMWRVNEGKYMKPALIGKSGVVDFVWWVLSTFYHRDTSPSFKPYLNH